MAERPGIGIKYAEVLPVAVVVQPGHQLDASVCAQRLSVGVFEFQPLAGQLVQTWCGVAFPAITPQSFNAEVVGHDQNNIRSLAGFQRDGEPGQQAASDQKKSHGETSFAGIKTQMSG